ncbi:carbon storage regulator [Rubripirellula tenax]|uniref:Translational regulator CsrA n=1 Tax=Rubripirellula tenax TaxID=2528015 RepID=A0A5C6FBC6_9BACT|nr:carbon storage regulator [Rubripirellula tenax]TWU56921.1 carbon storage regulator [Rubripirellula tenax]
MLVLSRKKGESIEFPSLGVVVRVLDLKKSRIEIGIDAPRDVAIVRGENVAVTGKQRASLASQPLAEIEARIAALAELADPKHRTVARQVAADAISRLGELRKSSPASPTPLADFVAIRTEVLDELRRQHEAQDAITCVRQASVGYAVGFDNAVSA